jgi:hypothetical protein
MLRKMLAKLQSAGPSLTPPLLQNRACEFPSTRLLSLRAIVIGTTQTLMGEGRLTTELLGQLAFTPSKTGVIKHEPFSKYRCHPAYPPHVSISPALPGALASWGILPAEAYGWLPAQPFQG